MASEAMVVEEVEALKRRLGKKQSFEEAVAALVALLRNRYPSASPTLRKALYIDVLSQTLHTSQKKKLPGSWGEIYSAINRVGTLLQTRYTTQGFWLAGLRLFEEAECLVTDPSEKEHLKQCIVRAHEQLHETDTEIPASNGRQTNSRYLFEGHLTVDPEPEPPAWLTAQNLLTALAVAQDWTSQPESSRSQEENDRTRESDRISGIPEFAQELINNMQHVSGFLDLDDVIEASLQEIGAGPQKPPPASKEVVANLPVITVTEEVIGRLGSETECAVCRENLVIDDKMQELPCKHLFHPPCLKPWLDEHNSCPVCRDELRTDDHAYESWKEREKEAEEERKGAANALRGGEFMYV